jgi:GAF domain-containing protein
MPERDVLLDALTEFARNLVTAYGIADVLIQLTDRVVGALHLDGAGVSVGDDHEQLRFVTASTDDLIEIEQAQEALQQGPCVSAWQSSQVILAEDLRGETRWPEYVPIALKSGYGAVSAIPLRNADRSIGSLNCYSRSARAWSEEDGHVALLFADMASSYLIHASALQRSERIREQLQQALDSRVIIEQAKGVLAARHSVSVDEAYKRLRRYTRSHNAHLHDIADAIVNLGLDVP